MALEIEVPLPLMAAGTGDGVLRVKGVLLTQVLSV